LSKHKKVTRQKANDAYQNLPANMGWGALNFSQSTEYPLTRLTMDFMKIYSLYRSDGIMRRIVDMPIEDACANWFKIDSQLTPNQIDMLEKRIKLAHIKTAFEKGLKWGRLFGGAAGLIMIDGQGDILDQPLNLSTIEPDSFKGIYIVDRWSGIYPELGTIDDINNPEFGLPEYYRVRTSEDGDSSTLVHHSRILRFMGEEVPYWEEQFEQHWGTSVIETVYDALTEYNNAYHNVANLIYQANVWVRKVAGIEELTAMGTRGQQERLLSALQAQQRYLSSYHTLILGTSDDMTNKSYSFSGLNDTFEIFMHTLSAVSHIPETKLFGRSPAGENATGESDLENYYTFIRDSIQESKMRPNLEKLLPVICMSELGAVPDDLNVRFNPIHNATENENADLVQKKATIINELFSSGLLPQKTALKELKEMSDSAGIFNNITDEDIKNADSAPDIGDMPGQHASDSFAENFDESKHPRRADGKFGNGGGNNNSEKAVKPLTIGKNGGTIKSSEFPELQPYEGAKCSIAHGTVVSNIYTFAGTGAKKPVYKENLLLKSYGGQAGEWQHTSGIGIVEVNGAVAKAEIHWFQEPSVGIVEARIKRWK
jgi:phage-related protein (TIGR01555 family)